MLLLEHCEQGRHWLCACPTTCTLTFGKQRRLDNFGRPSFPYHKQDHLHASRQCSLLIMKLTTARRYPGTIFRKMVAKGEVVVVQSEAEYPT